MKKLLLLIVAFLFISCGSFRKDKKTEIKEEEKIEVSEKKQVSETEIKTETESEKQSEKSQTDKRESEIHSDRTVTADEVFIDKDGNLSAKGNVQVNEFRNEKISEQLELNEIASGLVKIIRDEKINSESSESSELKESSKQKTTDKHKESESSILDLWWLWLIVFGVVFLFLKKVKNKMSLFSFF